MNRINAYLLLSRFDEALADSETVTAAYRESGEERSLARHLINVGHIFFRLDRFEEHLELHRQDCLSSHGGLDNYEFVKSKFEESPPEQLRPPRLLTGDDLIQSGYKPGPEFSRMLEAVEDAQLESRIHSKEEALDLIKSTFGCPS